MASLASRKVQQNLEQHVSEMSHPRPILCGPLMMSVDANRLPFMGVSPGQVRMASLCTLPAAATL